ncbi:MAG: dihydrolipoamide acetyltransferase family protein [Phycisphaerales bacterium]|jgi:pyruvate dehydrogenase E2 component (dihydrolipoamide acetyltransferase)
MAIELTMPRLSDTMESGTIIKWNVKEGDEVSAGDVVADVETDKATMEMQVYDDGRISKIAVPEGQTVSVGTLIAVIDDGDGDTAGTAATPAASTSGPASAPVDPDPVAPAASPAPAPAAAAPTGARRRVSPVARNIADEHGLDLSSIEGSGPGGRIVKQDVLAAIENRRAAGSGAMAPDAATASGSTSIPTGLALSMPTRPGPAAPSQPLVSAPLAASGRSGGEVPLSGMRQTIAKRLVESKQTIPHYQVTVRVDMDPVLELRRDLNKQLTPQGVKLSVNDFIVRACAVAMADHPYMNASWGGDRIVLHGAVNVGVAVSLPEERGGGLVVPTIRDADRKSLRWISEETRGLAEKARTKGLTVEEMSDATFTVSNLGMFGVEHFTAVINPPNSAILACGAALEQPVVRNGQLAVGHEMQATLSLDHRVIDGAMGAAWLGTFKSLLEHPAMLMV